MDIGLYPVTSQFNDDSIVFAKHCIKVQNHADMGG